MIELYVGLPAPLLGERNVRLPIVSSAAGLAIVEKPAQVAVEKHPWDGQRYPVLCEALRQRVEASSPDTVRLGWQGIWPVHSLDPEIHGLVALATQADAVDRWRNAYGSECFEFEFWILAAANPQLEDTFTCRLPVCVPPARGATISDKRGKRTCTHFTRLANARGYDWWCAKTRYLRQHHVRAQAAAEGIKILGECAYGGISIPELSHFRKLNKPHAKPLYVGAAVSLVALSVDGTRHALDTVPWKDLLRVIFDK